MTEILHAWALAPAAIGTCCLTVDRGRARAPEFVAAVLMLVAMADAARAQPLVAPLGWAVLLVVAALAIAVLRRTRRAQRRDADAGARRAAAGPSIAMTVQTTLGLVVMAMLLIALIPHTAAASPGHHGGGGIGIFALAAAAAGAYAAASVVLTARAGTWLDRAQFAAMGVSVLAMGLGVALM